MTIEEFVAIVQKTVKVRRIGRERYDALCVFHVEKTASLHIYKGRRGEGRYHCHGCGADGDGTDWLIKVEKKSFREAGGTSLGQELRKELEAKRERERQLNEYRNQHIDCVLPDWLLIGD